MPGGHAGLLPNLPKSAGLGCLAFIQGTCGQLQEIQSGSVPVLPDEEQVALVIQRNDDNRSNMCHDIQPGFMTIRQTQGVTADGKSAARIDDFGFK